MKKENEYARLIEIVSRGTSDVYDAVITGRTLGGKGINVIAIDLEDDQLFMGVLPCDEYEIEARSRDDILRRFKSVLLTSEETLQAAKATVKRRQWDLERDKERYEMVFKGVPWGVPWGV